MSLEAIVWAWKRPLNDYVELLLLLALADLANEDGECWPGYERLMERTRIKSRATLAKKLNSLEVAGYIERHKRPVFTGGSKTTIYRLITNPESSPNELSRKFISRTPKVHEVNSRSTVTQSVLPSQLNILCDSFGDWWKSYPKRQGSKGNKKTAERTYLIHLKNGFSEQDLLNAVHRYRHYCDVTGKIGTEYVKQATTFLNDTGNFENAWTVNHENNKRTSGCRNQKQETIAAIWGAPGVGSDPRADQRGQAAASERPVQDHAVEEATPAYLSLPDAGDHRNGKG
ncbi:helix-turn-helix domain-containing protein [Kistimonas asteriae]|uniref:helix-turn-helix domain-containing protein n=1 Tax=Kistimonas asteriae TaxID=517724 RepID=UPI001BAD0755|nr:helix-turn-helix domain-containing protein [Kistimonas asteriae]